MGFFVWVRNVIHRLSTCLQQPKEYNLYVLTAPLEEIKNNLMEPLDDRDQEFQPCYIQDIVAKARELQELINEPHVIF